MKIPCCFFPPCWDDDDDDMYLPSFFDIFIMLLSADRCDKFPHTINSCQKAHIYIVLLRMRHIN